MHAARDRNGHRTLNRTRVESGRGHAAEPGTVVSFRRSAPGFIKTHCSTAMLTSGPLDLAPRFFNRDTVLFGRFVLFRPSAVSMKRAAVVNFMTRSRVYVSMLWRVYGRVEFWRFVSGCGIVSVICLMVCSYRVGVLVSRSGRGRFWVKRCMALTRAGSKV